MFWGLNRLPGPNRKVKHFVGGVARIFHGGVQFAEILLTTPTFKKHAHYSQTKSHSVQQLGCFYIVAHKRVAKYLLNEHKKIQYVHFCPHYFQRHNNSHEYH